jgi:Ca2+-transporting ATPase
MSVPWYAQDVLYIVRALKTDLRTGLTTKEAMSRVHQAENTDLDLEPERPLWELVWEQVRNIRTPLLFVLSVGSFVWAAVARTPAYWQGVVLLVVGAADVCLRVWQRLLVGQHLSQVARGVNAPARVIRNARVVELDSQDVVVGDVLRLHAGDYIPADARLFAAENLCVTQTALTGISDPAPKEAVPLEGELSLQEQRNMAFAGTYVHSGTGSGVVVTTGPDRAICRLFAHHYRELPLVSTHEQIERLLPKLAWLAALGGVVLAFLLFQSGDAQGASTINAFSMGAALLLALIPAHTELSTVVLFVQNLRQLSRMGAVVRRHESLEELSQATTLCFDPEGVITRDEMAVHHVFVDGQVFSGEEVARFFAESEESSVAQTEAGEASSVVGPGGPLDASANTVPVDLYFLFVVSAMCALHADAGEEGWEAVESRAKQALLDMAAAVGVDSAEYDNLLVKVADLPYDSVRRRQSVLLRSGPDRGYLFALGSADAVLEPCRMVRLHGDEDVLQARQKETLVYLNNHLRSEAMQVVGVAYRRVTGDLDELAADMRSLEEDLTFVGIITFSDPLREHVGEALDACSRAGLRLVFMSDFETPVAYRLARDARLLEHRSQILSGEKLRVMEDEEFMPLTDRVTVYSQLTGDQKARVVQMLRRKGQRVAFLGRRLYDIPALRSADVSIAPSPLAVAAAAHEAGMVVQDASLMNLYQVLRFAQHAGRSIRHVVSWFLTAHVGMGLLFIGWWLLTAARLNVPTPMALGQLALLQLALFSVPFSFLVQEFRLTGARQWGMASRSTRQGVRWASVVRVGAAVALLALASGVTMNRLLGRSAGAAMGAQYAAVVTFVLGALVCLVRGLARKERSQWAFLWANGWLLGGIGTAVGLALVVALTPAGGLLAAPDAATWQAAPTQVEWVLALALGALAWIIPQSE